jgi:hypothetical protein
VGWEKVHGRLCPILPEADQEGRCPALDQARRLSRFETRAQPLLRKDWEFIEAGLEPFPHHLDIGALEGCRSTAW